MDTVASQLIDVAVATLRQHVVPDIATDAGRTYADLLTRVLRLVSSRLSIQEATLDRLRAEAAELADTAPMPAPDDGCAGGVVRASGNAPLEQAQAAAMTAESRLAARIPHAMAIASGEDADGGTIAWLRRVVETQEAYFTTLDPDVRQGSQVAYRGGRIVGETFANADDAPKRATPAALTRYFRARCGDEAISVGGLHMIPGGFSKTTYLVDLATGTIGGAPGVVIRQDPLVPYNCKTIAEEYDLLRRLHAIDFPIAPPLLLEEDTTVLGSAFAVSRRMPGSGNVHEWAAAAGSIEPFARMLAEALARLHAIRLDALGYPADIAELNAGEHMRREIARWEALFEAKRRRPYPMNTLMLSWLKENIPAKAFATRASVVHGDVGFHNLLVDGENLSCILDWEYSHFGDPAEDLVFVKPFVAPLFDWERFKAIYYAAGGADVTAEDEAYYSVWTGARNSISCVDAVSVVETALPDELKYIVSGYILMPYVQIDACKAILSHMEARQREAAG